MLRDLERDLTEKQREMQEKDNLEKQKKKEA